MRRIAFLIVTAVVSGAAIASCGFQLADDTGKPIPGQYWPWVCADGATPGDAGCAPDAGSADH
jgi:hypothetical protein